VQKQIEDRAARPGVSLEQSTRDIILAPVPTKEFVTVEQIAARGALPRRRRRRADERGDLVLDGGWTAR
jgi:3-hydroxybutyrate dehydrogenase